MTPIPRHITKHVLTLGGAALLALAISAAMGDAYTDQWGYLQKGITLLGVILGFNMVFIGLCMDWPEFAPGAVVVDRDDLEALLKVVTRNPRVPEVKP